MTVFLDSDVLIDCLRGTEPSRIWLETVVSESFQVPGIVAMELAAGCQNRLELERMQKFLAAFEIVWPDASDMRLAYELLATHRLASNLGIPDCIIASMALARSARLYTFNHKHFRVVVGLDVQQPYNR